MILIVRNLCWRQGSRWAFNNGGPKEKRLGFCSYVYSLITSRTARQIKHNALIRAARHTHKGLSANTLSQDRSFNLSVCHPLWLSCPFHVLPLSSLCPFSLWVPDYLCGWGGVPVFEHSWERRVPALPTIDICEHLQVWLVLTCCHTSINPKQKIMQRSARWPSVGMRTIFWIVPKLTFYCTKIQIFKRSLKWHRGHQF